MLLILFIAGNKKWWSWSTTERSCSWRFLGLPNWFSPHLGPISSADGMCVITGSTVW